MSVDKEMPLYQLINAAKVRGLSYEILAKRARALSANQQDGIR